MQNRPKKKNGQAMVLFLGFAAAMGGMMLVSFNSGQVTNAKMKAMNAADAAAYSGAVWEARTLNFQAYLNRAMVVNEVTIAQSVSLRSWIDYLDRFVTNVNYITEFIPYAGEVTTAIADGLAEVDNVVQTVLPITERAMRALNVVEHGAQVGINATAAVIAQALAAQVAKKNNARMTPGGMTLLAENELRWFRFTQNYGKGNGRVGSDPRTRMREVVLNSRDGFTTARDWKAGFPLVFEIRKQGGTDLLDFDSWKGVDSAELRTIWNPLKGKWSTKVPVGWGGAQAYKKEIDRLGRHGNYNEWNDADGQLAKAESNGSNAKSVSIDFQGYRDIVNPRVKDAKLHLPFAVEVVIDSAAPAGGVATITKGAKPAAVKLTDWSTLDLEPHFVNTSSGTFALAEACVRFSRPYGAERSDRAKEYPSLFNPYWRAELATESRTARTIVDVAKGLVPLSALVSPTGTCT